MKQEIKNKLMELITTRNEQDFYDTMAYMVAERNKLLAVHSAGDTAPLIKIKEVKKEEDQKLGTLHGVSKQEVEDKKGGITAGIYPDEEIGQKLEDTKKIPPFISSEEITIEEKVKKYEEIFQDFTTSINAISIYASISTQHEQMTNMIFRIKERLKEVGKIEEKDVEDIIQTEEKLDLPPKKDYITFKELGQKIKSMFKRKK